MKKLCLFLSLLAMFPLSRALSVEEYCPLEKGRLPASAGGCEPKENSPYLIFCTMEFAVMIHEERGICRVGRNGCMIQDLMQKGFRRALRGECPGFYRAFHSRNSRY